MLVFKMVNDSNKMARLLNISTTQWRNSFGGSNTMRVWWAEIEFIKHLLTFDYNAIQTLNGNRTTYLRIKYNKHPLLPFMLMSYHCVKEVSNSEEYFTKDTFMSFTLTNSIYVFVILMASCICRCHHCVQL